MGVFTDRDMRQELLRTLDGLEQEYDLEAILYDLIMEYGVVPLDQIPGDQFWEVVSRHLLATRPALTAEQQAKIWSAFMPLAMNQPEQLRAWLNRHGAGDSLQEIHGALQRDHEEALKSTPESREAERRQEVIEALRRINSSQGAGDDHEEADKLILGYLPADVREAYQAVVDNAHGWWFS